jgi:glycosyltransferase involved in cell wall biosynthesis
MRLLHVHSGNLYGGIEAFLATLARRRELAELDHEFALCFDGRLADELREAGAAVYPLGGARLRNPLSIRRIRSRLRDRLERGRFDAVACHSAWAMALCGNAIKAARTPLVFWVHGAIHGRHWLERWARATEPNLLLCNSAYSAATIAPLYPRVPREILYLPVQPLSPITPGARRMIREEFATPDEATVIAIAARGEPLKGHAVLLEGLAMLRNLEGWRCWIIGGAQRPVESEYFARLKALAAAREIGDRVCFCGEQPAAAQILAAADIYCQPNTAPEGFGIAFAEAMGAHLAIVTTALGGVAELIDESCAMVVEPNDPRALATALRELIENPVRRERLASGGAARVRRLCDPSTQMGRLARVIAAVCDPAMIARLRA